MNAPAPHPAESPAQRQLLADIVPAFEDAWKAGSQPRLELFLSDSRVLAAGESFAAELFRDLLQIELRRRQRLGESLAVEDYLRRFPQQAAVVAECFGTARKIGVYQLLKLLGSGGMGEVYLALNELTEQTCALKVIRGHLASDSQAVGRFLREIKSLAKLNHPNVVAARHADRSDDLLYLVMEYVAGHNLDEIRRHVGKLSTADACAAICQAAAGLAHAHQQQVIHRDLKPHNLMLTRDGTVKVLDFGLAKWRRESPMDGKVSFETSHDAAVGTPHFMAPEQLNSAAVIDARADVYGLGATLYYLLTGHTPLAGSNLLELVAALATSAPRPLAELRPELPPELASVVMKMLAKKPDDRFASMVEVQTALVPFAAGSDLPRLFEHALAASRIDEPRASGPWMDEATRIKTGSTATKPRDDRSLVSTDRSLAMTLASSPAETEQPVESHRALNEPAGARTGRHRRHRILATVAVTTLAIAVWFGITLVLASGQGRIIVECPDPAVNVRVQQNGEEVRGLQVQLTDDKKRAIKIQAGTFEISLDADKRDRFEVLDNTVTVTRGKDVRVRVRLKDDPLANNSPRKPSTSLVAAAAKYRVPDPPRNQSSPWSLMSVAPSGPVSNAVWSPDGEWIAYGSANGDLRICRADTLETVHYLDGHVSVITGISWRDDGQRIVTSSDDHTLRLWTATGKSLATIDRHGVVADVAWQPGGKKFASLDNAGGNEGVGQGAVWDEDGQQLASFTMDKFYGSRIVWSADGRRIVSCGGEHVMRFWREDGTPDGEFASLRGGIGLSWNRAGVLSTTGGDAKSFGLRVPGADQWQQVKLPTGVGYGTEWSPDAGWLAVVTSAGVYLAKLIEPADGEMRIAQSFYLEGDSSKVAWHPAGNRILVGGDTLSLWTLQDDDPATAKKTVSLASAKRSPIRDVAWQPGGEQFAAVGSDGLAALFDRNGKPIVELAGHEGAVGALAWSADGEWLATGGQDKTVRLWTRHGEKGKTFSDFESGVTGLAWAHNDHWLAASAGERTARLFHPQQGAGPTMDNQTDVHSIAWSRNDDRLACGLSRLVGIQFWTKASNYRTAEIRPSGSPGGLRDLAATLDYHPKLDRLAAGASYGTAGILDHESGKWTPLAILDDQPHWLHTGSVTKIRWSHRGDRLATAANDGMVGLWTADGQHVSTLTIGGGIHALAWSPDDRWLAAGNTAGEIWVWDFDRDDGKRWNANFMAVTSLAWDSRSQRVSLGTAGGMLRVLDVESGDVVSTTLFRPGKKSLGLDAAGKLTHGEPDDFSRDFVYRVRSDDGAVEFVSPADFQKRLGANDR